MKKYSVILFDADGTLFDFPKCEREAFRDALLRSGVDADEAMVSAYHKINDDLWKALERKEIERSELVFRRFEIFAECYGLSIDSKIMARDYADCLAEKVYFIDGARELISALYGKVRMYIITNGIERVQRRRWELSGLESYFDGLFISEAIGANKPDPRFFDCVAASIEGFERDCALVVGDSLSSDIAGGAGYRIDTCWFAPDGEESSLPTYTVRALDEVLPIALGE